MSPEIEGIHLGLILLGNYVMAVENILVEECSPDPQEKKS